MAKRRKKKRQREAAPRKAASSATRAPAAAKKAAAPEPSAAAPADDDGGAPGRPDDAPEERRGVPAPAELSVRRILGAAAVAAALLVALSGLYLLWGYEEGRAHDAMKEVVGVMPLGALMRALHRIGAHVLLGLLGCYLLAHLLARVPDRPAAQIVTLALLGIVGALTCTGEVLPWDRRARATVAATSELGRALPVIGALQDALRGGPEAGPSTRRRSFYLHLLPLPLPLAGLGLLIVRLRMARRSGPSGPLLQRTELTVALGAATVLLLLAAAWPVALGAAADARITVDPAKAPWYLAGWQEVDSYAPAVGLLFGVLLAVLLLLEAWLGPAKAAPGPVSGRVRWLTATGLLGGAVTAVAGVWWWRDPSYGAPALLNPATIVLLVAACAAAVSWWRVRSRAATVRLLLCAVLGAALLFTLVGWLGRGPRWELAWHPGPGSAAEVWPR